VYSRGLLGGVVERVVDAMLGVLLGALDLTEEDSMVLESSMGYGRYAEHLFRNLFTSFDHRKI
jgi:hypothetical protein